MCVCMLRWERSPLRNKALVLIYSTFDSLLSRTWIRGEALLLSSPMYEAVARAHVSFTNLDLQVNTALHSAVYQPSNCLLGSSKSLNSEWTYRYLLITAMPFCFKPWQEMYCHRTTLCQLFPMQVWIQPLKYWYFSYYILLLLYPLHLYKTQIPKLSSINLCQ